MRLSTLTCTALLTLSTTPTSILADQPPYSNDSSYDAGEYGAYPVQHYKSSNAIAPRLNILQHSPDCDDGLFTFLSPRGYSGAARRPRAVILDSKGTLIWSSGWREQQIYNLMVQKYKGEDYITFWAGDDSVGGHGAGSYYMLDRNYKLAHKVTAANGLAGDLHEFRITEQGTAMMTVYQAVNRDLSSLGKTVGPIWDCLIQEVDIATGELVFEWRASDHVELAQTYRSIGGEGEPDGVVFDWFHINSVDKDPDGNYIVSSRYLHTVTKIDGRTGDVLWVLGGKANMFKDLSDGKATNFAFQHDARWTNNFSELSLFDNSDDNANQKDSYPRGLRIQIDQKAMTAKLLAEYKNQEQFTAASQGSMQVLGSGNVMVGFGYSAAFTEFDHDGHVLCDTHFGPLQEFGGGGVQSYRVYKYAWQGRPGPVPDLAIAQDEDGFWRAYFSWNGATDVAVWVLQGTDEPSDLNQDPWQDLAISHREGFETSIPLEVHHPRYVRVVAFDAKSNKLASSWAYDAAMANVTHNSPELSQYEPVSVRVSMPRAALWMGVVAGGAFALACGMRPACAAWRRRRAGGHLGDYRPLLDTRTVV